MATRHDVPNLHGHPRSRRVGGAWTRTKARSAASTAEYGASNRELGRSTAPRCKAFGSASAVSILDVAPAEVCVLGGTAASLLDVKEHNAREEGWR